jgi:endonuclease/exonuclease/phosphatase family metal-dependent hydrolase
VTDIFNRLSIVLWNTKLSPPLNKYWSKSTSEAKNKVSNVVRLFISLNYDFICLSEVSPTDIEHLNSELSLYSKGYDFYIIQEKTRDVYFDTAILYKRNFSCIECNFFIDGENNHKLKAYQKYIFQNIESKDYLVFYFTHWPSMLADNAEARRSISSYIRANLNEMKNKDSSIKFIVLGDFNAEPYQPSMVSGLKSSRHQSIVKANPHLLYNPFWQFLSCRNENPTGTFYYKQGENHKWSVLDQILLSGSFFKEGWIIKDENIEILNIKELMRVNFGVNFSNPSDHRAVHAILEK